MLYSAWRRALFRRGRNRSNPLKFQLRQLEAFRAVAETGNVTKAAKSLGVSQPAVSRLLSDFGKSIGFELFERRRVNGGVNAV